MAPPQRDQKITFDPNKPSGGVGDVSNQQGNVETPATPIDANKQQPLNIFENPSLYNLTRIQQNALRQMDSSTLQIRLVGTNRIVIDNRESADRKAGSKDASKADNPNKEMRLKDGKVQDAVEKRYHNYLAARQTFMAEKGDNQKLRDRQFSEFEKSLIERFEQGKKIEESSKEGKSSFLAKTVEQWRSFFAKFTGRTAQKSAELADIQEFLFRGLVKKSDAKAVMISDIIHSNGLADKFARFGIIYNKVGDFLATLLPGDAFSKQAISDGLTANKLYYLALNPPSLESELLTGMKPKQGMFASEATEARVAAELGIAMDKGAPAGTHHHVDGKRKKRGAGGLMHWLVGEDDVPSDVQNQFVPWWQWGTLKKPGGFTLKRAFYSAVIIAFVLTILFLVDRFLLGK